MGKDIDRVNRYESLLFCSFLSFFNPVTVFHQRTFLLWKWKKFRISKFPFLLSNLIKSSRQFLLHFISINSSSTLILSIPPPPYFYQFLHLPKFINFSFSLHLSIPPLPYFHQFFFHLISINSSSSLFLSILFPSLFLTIPPLPYFYEFLFLPQFINFSFSLLLSIPPFPYFYQFLFPLFLSIFPLLYFFQRVQKGKGYRAWYMHRLNRFESLLFCFFLSFFNRVTILQQKTFSLWEWKNSE